VTARPQLAKADTSLHSRKNDHARNLRSPIVPPSESGPYWQLLPERAPFLRDVFWSLAK
jgi:hypothetical protein